MRRGFTLVELLVVIGIIALLVSVMLPTLGAARRSAEAVTCSSNLRQLATVMFHYAGDHKGRMPPGAARFWDASLPNDSNLRRWHGEREDDDAAFVSERGPIFDYLETGEVNRCPSFDHEAVEYESGQAAAFESGTGGYGYNATYVGRDVPSKLTSMLGARLSQFRSSSETVLLADTAFLRPGRLIEYGFVEPPAAGVDPSTHFRHDGRANVAWLDGHVSPQVMSFTRGNVYTVTKSQNEAAAVGFFGPIGVSLFDRE